MNGYRAFLKKEWMESVRTYKLLIMLFTFITFGIISPLFAKLMPEVLATLTSSQDMGMVLKLPTPTALDSYAQFFKNVSQMGLIIFLLVFSGMISQEVSKGTLIPILTKGVSRKAIILAKFSVAASIWTFCYIFAFSITYSYTQFSFPELVVEHLIFSVICLWLFGIFLLSLFLWMSCITNGNYGGLLLSVLCFGILLLLNMFHEIQKFNPITLSSSTMEMLSSSFDISTLYSSIIVTILLTIGCILMAIIAFRKKRL